MKEDITNYLAQRLNLKEGRLDRVKEDITNYLAQRLNLSKEGRLRKEVRKDKKEDSQEVRKDKKEDNLKDRIDVIVDASSVTYYDNVRETLPGVAQQAVLATLGEKNYAKEEHEKVFKESLKKLKRMMVFYRLREDKKVAETILYSAVYANLKDISISDKQLENGNTSSSRNRLNGKHM